MPEKHIVCKWLPVHFLEATLMKDVSESCLVLKPKKYRQKSLHRAEARRHLQIKILNNNKHRTSIPSYDLIPGINDKIIIKCTSLSSP